MNITGGLTAIAIAVGAIVAIATWIYLMIKWPFATYLSTFLICFLAMIFLFGATP